MYRVNNATQSGGSIAWAFLPTLLWGFAVGLFESSATADWPGLLGPTRNGHADANSPIPDSLDGEAKQIWKTTAGQGYAGPSVAGNDFVLFERVADNDVVRLLNLETGKEVWRRQLKAGYRGGMDSDKGPRSVPTILEKSILVYSAAGDLTLLNRADGSIKWSRALRREYNAEDGYFGAGSTPLVVGEKAIVLIGGKTVGVACISLLDGKPLWTSAPLEASYASPVLLPAGTNVDITSPIVIVPGKLKTVALDPGTGKELWSVAFGQRGPTVNAATPIVNSAGNLFVTSSYGIGSLIIAPKQLEANVSHKGSEISSQYCTPIAMGGRIFGSDGREDGGGGSYKCLQEADGKLIWEKPNMPICHTFGGGSRVLILGINGEIWALDSAAISFQPLWSTRLPEGVYRAIPAYSGGRLYVRTSNGNEDSWYCFQIAPRTTD